MEDVKLTQSRAQVQADLNKIEATPTFTTIGTGLTLVSNSLDVDTSKIASTEAAGNSVDMGFDSSDNKLSLSLKNAKGTVLGSTQEVTLPLASCNATPTATTDTLANIVLNGTTYIAPDHVSGEDYPIG